MTERIRNRQLLEKLTDEESAVRQHVRGAKCLAFGGMGGQSVPKLIPSAMLSLRGELGETGLTVLNGGGATASFEKFVNGIDVARRYYYLSGSESREKVNSGRVSFFDYWVAEYSRMLREGGIPAGSPIDVAVIEATGITEEGGIVPSLSVDASMAMVHASRKVIVEINTAKPELMGLHDLYLPIHGEPIEIRSVMDRVGRDCMTIQASKIAAVVTGETREEVAGSYSRVSGDDLEIADRLSTVLDSELSWKGFDSPLQLGAGPIASAVIEKIDRESLQIWSEIIPSRWTAYLGSKVKCVSASAVYTLPGEQHYTDAFLDDFGSFDGSIVLRPNEITNSGELISRLGVVAVQPAISIDIFGGANVSHIGGRIHNGVGGSGDFTRSARTTILALPSATSDCSVSRIVPMLANVDIPKQDADMVVTEQGVADLRGLGPAERANLIIDRCSHPAFKDRLQRYLSRALERKQHLPFDPSLAAQWMG